MITEHILFYPHKEYDTKRETTGNLRNRDYIQYGYIKKRDLDKWLNNEVVPVKMGMLTPSNKCYHKLTILDSALKRIKEQDTTALFDDEDELIPIYIFVSEETDNEWREYLISQGFKVSRKNANREGVKIKKSDIGLHYGKHYGYNTEEVLSEKEQKIQNQINAEKKRQELAEKAKKENRERDIHIFENELGYGEGSYYEHRKKQKDKKREIKATKKYDEVHFNPQTLDLIGYNYTYKDKIKYYGKKEETILIMIMAFLGVLLLTFAFLDRSLLFNDLLGDGVFYGITGFSLLSLSIFLLLTQCESITFCYAKTTLIHPNGKQEKGKTIKRLIKKKKNPCYS